MTVISKQKVSWFFGEVVLIASAGKHSLKRGKVYAIENIFFITGQSKSLRTGSSCGKVGARVFEQFSNLSSLSLRRNQLEVIFDRLKMMLTQRNGIYVEAELARRRWMTGTRDEHTDVSGKPGLGLSCPFASYTKMLVSHFKIMTIDTTEMTYRTGVCETCDLRLFLAAKVWPLDLGKTKTEAGIDLYTRVPLTSSHF